MGLTLTWEYDAVKVAHYFLELASKDDRQLTNMQVIKLVYIAHGWLLGIRDRPLIRENVQAWKYGPVIPNVYHRYRQYKDGPITLRNKVSVETHFDREAKSMIQQTYEIYGKHSAGKLSAMTHVKGTPWDESWVEGSNAVIIPNELIRNYYFDLS